MSTQGSPQPYPFAEGAMAMRLCDVPDGWEYRYCDTDPKWLTPTIARDNTIVEARPRKPATVTVPIEDVRVGDVLMAPYLEDVKVASVEHRTTDHKPVVRLRSSGWVGTEAAYGTRVEIRERS